MAELARDLRGSQPSLSGFVLRCRVRFGVSFGTYFSSIKSPILGRWEGMGFKCTRRVLWGCAFVVLLVCCTGDQEKEHYHHASARVTHKKFSIV